MSQVLYEAAETATLRPDEERPPLGPELALANAPQPGGGYFKVPASLTLSVCRRINAPA